MGVPYSFGFELIVVAVALFPFSGPFALVIVEDEGESPQAKDNILGAVLTS